MSQALLQEIRAKNALMAPVAFDELADVHVSLAALTGRNCEEQLVAAGLRQRGCVCVLGGRGNGKSSLIAGASASLATKPRLCVRVKPIELPSPQLEGFLEHVAQAVFRATGERPRSAAAGVATSTSITTGGHSAGGSYAQIRSAAQQVIRTVSQGDRLEAIGEVARVAEDQKHPIVLILDDTDPYLPAPMPGATTALGMNGQDFVAGPLHWLAREAPFPSLVGAFDGYECLMDATFDKVSLPKFKDAGAAIGAIACRYLRRHGLVIDDASDLIEQGALEVLAEMLSDRSVRDVLRALRDAGDEAASDPDATLITETHVRAVA